MNRRVLPPTIILVTLTIILGLLQSFQRASASVNDGASSYSRFGISSPAFTASPLDQGAFTSASLSSRFTIEVQNAGDADDTYELDLDSDWPAFLYQADGATPLSDTNSSGGIDTGNVGQGQKFTVVARVETPSDAVMGDSNNLQLVFHSSVSQTLAVTTSMRSAVPAPFAQTMYEQSGDSMNLIMSEPGGSWQAKTTPDGWYGGPATYYPDLAVGETISGYVYVWANWHSVNNVWRSEVEYQFTDKTGQTTSPIVKLTDLSTVTVTTLDGLPAVSVAPDGNIGISWYRKTVGGDTAELYNVYLAVLDATGTPVTDTINLTNNAQWRDPVQPAFEAPSFYAPVIAATKDNHFFVAWESSVLTYTDHLTETYNLDDVYYAIYASDGISITDPINVSQNVPGQLTRSLRPAVTGVNVDRVFLTWAQRRPEALGTDDLIYTVINTTPDAPPVKTKTAVAGVDDFTDWSNFDVVELSNGVIIAAWESYGCYEAEYGWSARIRYMAFRSNNYGFVMNQPGCLPPTVVAEGGDDGVSLVADNMRHAILSWTDRAGGTRKHLYYALLDDKGAVVTEPMIFHWNDALDDNLSTGLNGYGAASRLFLDAAVTINPALRRGISTEPVTYTIDLRNNGAVTGTGAVVTLTLAPVLTHSSDTAPVGHTIVGNTIVWSFATAAPWAHASFDVALSIDQAANLMATYPLTVSVAVDGQEATLANNWDTAGVYVGRSNYLPAVIR